MALVSYTYNNWGEPKQASHWVKVMDFIVCVVRSGSWSKEHPIN